MRMERASPLPTARTVIISIEGFTARFSDARALILGSLFRAPFDDPEIIQSVLSAAKAAGQIVFATQAAEFPRFLKLDDLKDSLPLIDYITPNEDEARYFSGKEDPEEMADIFLSYGVRNVIIKLGGRGCLFKSAEESIFLPACEIHAVDATGAGDNFVAGFASEILRGASDADALRFANAAARSAPRLSVRAALQSREQVLRFWKTIYRCCN